MPPVQSGAGVLPGNGPGRDLFSSVTSVGTYALAIGMIAAPQPEADGHRAQQSDADPGQGSDTSTATIEPSQPARNCLSCPKPLARPSIDRRSECP